MTDTPQVYPDLHYISFARLSDEDLRLVWQWRNQDEVRLNMTHKEVFSLEQHLDFCHRLRFDLNNLYLQVRSNGVPYGVITLRHIDRNQHICDGGSYFIGAPGWLPYTACVLNSLLCNRLGIYRTRQFIYKDNESAMLFNLLKLRYRLTGEDETYYYLLSENFDLSRPEAGSFAALLRELTLRHRPRFDI